MHKVLKFIECTDKREEFQIAGMSLPELFNKSRSLSIKDSKKNIRFYRSVFYICVALNKFVHHTAVFYLVVIMLVRMLAMPISLIEYSLNKNYIIASLCENRNRPDIHCFGSCFLNKQLSRSNESQESRNPKTNSKTVTIDFFEQMEIPLFGGSTQGSYVYAKPVSQAELRPFTGNIFHPPIA